MPNSLSAIFCNSVNSKASGWVILIQHNEYSMKKVSPPWYVHAHCLERHYFVPTQENELISAHMCGLLCVAAVQILTIFENKNFKF